MFLKLNKLYAKLYEDWMEKTELRIIFIDYIHSEILHAKKIRVQIVLLLLYVYQYCRVHAC